MKLRSLFPSLIALVGLLAITLGAIAPVQAQTLTPTYTYRSGIQEYATVALLRAEVLAPKPADVVQVEAIDTALLWNATSVAVDDGVNVIKQTSIATGRWINVAYSQVFNVAGVNIPALSSQSCTQANVAVTGVVVGKTQKVQLSSGTITAGVTIIPTIKVAANAIELQLCNVTGSATTAFAIGLTVLQK